MATVSDSGERAGFDDRARLCELYEATAGVLDDDGRAENNPQQFQIGAPVHMPSF